MRWTASTQQSPGSRALSARRNGGFSPAARGGEADTLADRVHSGVGSTGRVRDGPAAEETLQNSLELGLNGAAGRLALPADKAGAVVVQHGEEGPAHRPGI